MIRASKPNSVGLLVTLSIIAVLGVFIWKYVTFHFTVIPADKEMNCYIEPKKQLKIEVHPSP